MANVKCPRCKKTIEYSPSNPYRPFCSERCQMIDLGKWANEEYSIPIPHNSSDPVSEPSEDENSDSLRLER